MDRALRFRSPSPSLARATVGAGCALAVGAIVVGSGWAAGAPNGAAERSPRQVTGRPAAATDPVLARLGLPPLKGRSALPGYLLIADRDNNRLIIVNPRKQIVRRFPRLPGPDDAFVSANGRYVSTNEEFSETIMVLTLARRPKIVWRYGHQGVQGSAYGYLAHPDDAYLLKNGLIQVADIVNCRLLWINHAKQIVRSLGRAGACGHDPPRTFSSPNGDTPLRDGGVLITEIGGWIDRLSASGKLLWSIRSPTDYPSDAQLLPNGRVLVAAYNSPGRIDVLGRGGRIVWSYGPASGPGALDHPSLAIRLPNGMIAANDDYNDRVVVINMRTKRIVWQYGHDGSPGSAPGYLRNPDGIDLIL
jgi:hypothetical protein